MKIKKDSNKVEEQIGENKLYELGYLLLPVIAEEQLAGEVANIVALIEKKGGVFLSSEIPVLKDLTYTMVKAVSDKKNRFNTAYFGWIKFEARPDVLRELKKDFDLYKNLLRYLLMNSNKENVAVSKKFSFVHADAQAEEGKRVEEVKTTEVQEIKKVTKTKKKKEELSEDIDKTIDELVVD